MRRSLQLCLAFLACLLTTVAVHAQYPDKTITLVVPFPPGGVADTVARPVAEAISLYRIHISEPTRRSPIW
jgi:tripartite-type tricarboxylate transporter receptor subunit TctC